MSTETALDIDLSVTLWIHCRVYTRPQTSSQWVYNDIQIPLRKNCFRGSNLGESTIVYCY